MRESIHALRCDFLCLQDTQSKRARSPVLILACFHVITLERGTFTKISCSANTQCWVMLFVTSEQDWTYESSCDTSFGLHKVVFKHYNSTFPTFIHSLAAAQDVSVVRIEPDPLQQLPCPQQMIQFRCQILVPSFAVEWILPTSETLEFGQAENVGAVYVSSDNAYSATLTDRTGDPNSNNRFFFTSTLLVMEPVNGSNLTCVGVRGIGPVEERTSIILSGKNCCYWFFQHTTLPNPSCLPKA